MKTGILLVALGTPKSLEIKDVRAYLAAFLGDPLVIQKPRWFWLPILHGMILRVRPKYSASMYAQVWRYDAADGIGSPLLHFTKIQTEQLQALLPECEVRFAMTYGAPSIADSLREMRQAGVTDLRVIPLNPQYSTTTVEPIIRQVKAADAEATVLPEFYADDRYVGLLAHAIAEKWEAKPYDKLIFSYHGIPVSYVKKGDPYQAQSEAITRAVVAKLGLAAGQYEHTYQSKFGTDKWLGPATIKRMAALPKENAPRILIVSPSFVHDCLETLFELQIENRRVFMENGGQLFDFVHPFNESQEFTAFLRDWALGN